MKKIVGLLVLSLVVVFTQGCGNYRDENTQKISVYSPKSGDRFSICGDKPMYVEFIGPADKVYSVHFILSPNFIIHPSTDGAYYDERFNGYRVGGFSMKNPKSRYSFNIDIPKDIPAGAYTLKIVFARQNDFWELSPVLYSGESEEFEIN
jgi:hypothetical protein